MVKFQLNRPQEGSKMPRSQQVQQVAREVQVKETTHQETKTRMLNSISQEPSRMNPFTLRNPQVLKFRPRS